MKLVLICLSVVAWTVASVAGQACPGTVCKSYFANAIGGPVDCCNHNYAANSKCVWGGSPVSFTRSRSCSQDSNTYDVLIGSNYQGPPGSNECRCEKPSAATVTAPTVKMTVEMKPKSGKDIKGSDIGCSGQSFCKVCGGLQAVQSACAGQPKCVAFTFEAATNCGFLKSAAEPLGDRSGWVAYSR